MKNPSEGVELRFNSRLYDKQCILNAMEMFKNVCEFSLNEEGNYNIVSLKVKGQDPRKIGYEFSNYVLGLMKNTGKV